LPSPGNWIQSDVTNIPEFFLRNPDWHVAYDADPDLAQQTRHYRLVPVQWNPMI
jgi:hypothetical protein